LQNIATRGRPTSTSRSPHYDAQCYGVEHVFVCLSISVSASLRIKRVHTAPDYWMFKFRHDRAMRVIRVNGASYWWYIKFFWKRYFGNRWAFIVRVENFCEESSVKERNVRIPMRRLWFVPPLLTYRQTRTDTDRKLMNGYSTGSASW